MGNVAELLDPSKSLVQIETYNDSDTKEKLRQTKWASFLHDNTGCLQLKMNKEEVPQLIADLVSLQVQLLSVNPIHSLEDYFLSLTNNDTHVEPFAN